MVTLSEKYGRKKQVSDRIEISKESNKIWHAEKLIGANPSLNYYAFDIKDSALDFEEDEEVSNRIMIVWVNKTTEEIGLDYMGPKMHATSSYSKGNLVTNPTNKRALRDAVIDLFNNPPLNESYVIVTGSIDDD